jgi:hypothetical protein
MLVSLFVMYLEPIFYIFFTKELTANFKGGGFDIWLVKTTIVAPLLFGTLFFWSRYSAISRLIEEYTHKTEMIRSIDIIKQRFKDSDMLKDEDIQDSIKVMLLDFVSSPLNKVYKNKEEGFTSIFKYIYSNKEEKEKDKSTSKPS